MLKVYSKDNCPKCVELKSYLTSNSIPFEVVDVMTVEGARDFLVAGGFRTVPQVFTENMLHFGDCDNTIKKFKAYREEK